MSANSSAGSFHPNESGDSNIVDRTVGQEDDYVAQEYAAYYDRRDARREKDKETFHQIASHAQSEMQKQREEQRKALLAMVVPRVNPLLKGHPGVSVMILIRLVGCGLCGILD